MKRRGSGTQCRVRGTKVNTIVELGIGVSERGASESSVTVQRGPCRLFRSGIAATTTITQSSSQLFRISRMGQ